MAPKVSKAALRPPPPAEGEQEGPAGDGCRRVQILHAPPRQPADIQRLTIAPRRAPFAPAATHAFPVSCDDHDVCTSDFCDAVLGCQHDPAPASICDDGIACTQDSCANNACINTPTCDDGDPCTNDSCSLTLGQCTHTSACDDGNPCTTDLCRLKKNGTLSCKHVSNNCSG